MGDYVAPPAGITTVVPANVRIEGGTGVLEADVEAAGTAGANALTIGGTGTAGNIGIEGQVAAGTSLGAGRPVVIAGQDSTPAVRVLSLAINGTNFGSPAVLAVGGSDNGNAARLFLTDTGGRQVVIGGNATGSAPTVNGMRVIAFDGTVMRDVTIDTSGRVNVVGATAAGSAVAGNPLLLGISDGTNVQSVRAGSPTAEPGSVGVLAVQLHAQDGTNIVRLRSDTNNADGLAGSATNNKLHTIAGQWLFNGTTWDRGRSVAVGDNAAATGIAAAGLMLFDGATFDRARSDGAATGALLIGGQGVAGTPAGGVLTVQGATSMTPVQTAPAIPVAANVVAGTISHSTTTAAATLITVPQARVWIGTIGITAACQSPAANATTSSVRGLIATAGTNVTPAAGTVLAVEAKNGANSATGTVGTQGEAANAIPNFVVIAPAGNAVTLTAATTIGTGGTAVADYFASGLLQ